MTAKKLIGLTVVWTWYIIFGIIISPFCVPIVGIALIVGGIAFVVNGAAHWAGIDHEVL